MPDDDSKLHLDENGRVVLPEDAQPATKADRYTQTAAVANCPLCDDDGYRDMRVCDHVDRSGMRGSVIARQALAEARAERGQR